MDPLARVSCLPAPALLGLFDIGSTADCDEIDAQSSAAPPSVHHNTALAPSPVVQPSVADMGAQLQQFLASMYTRDPSMQYVETSPDADFDRVNHFPKVIINPNGEEQDYKYAYKGGRCGPLGGYSFPVEPKRGKSGASGARPDIPKILAAGPPSRDSTGATRCPKAACAAYTAALEYTEVTRGKGAPTFTGQVHKATRAAFMLAVQFPELRHYAGNWLALAFVQDWIRNGVPRAPRKATVLPRLDEEGSPVLDDEGKPVLKTQWVKRVSRLSNIIISSLCWSQALSAGFAGAVSCAARRRRLASSASATAVDFTRGQRFRSTGTSARRLRVFRNNY